MCRRACTRTHTRLHARTRKGEGGRGGREGEREFCGGGGDARCVYAAVTCGQRCRFSSSSLRMHHPQVRPSCEARGSSSEDRPGQMTCCAQVPRDCLGDCRFGQPLPMDGGPEGSDLQRLGERGRQRCEDILLSSCLQVGPDPEDGIPTPSRDGKVRLLTVG